MYVAIQASTLAAPAAEAAADTSNTLHIMQYNQAGRRTNLDFLLWCEQTL